MCICILNASVDCFIWMYRVIGCVYMKRHCSAAQYWGIIIIFIFCFDNMFYLIFSYSISCPTIINCGKFKWSTNDRFDVIEVNPFCIWYKLFCPAKFFFIYIGSDQMELLMQLIWSHFLMVFFPISFIDMVMYFIIWVLNVIVNKILTVYGHIRILF